MGTPVDHLISAISPGKFARLGTPTLPSVKEEEDTQAEAETSDLVPVRRVDSSQDPNRDSGFVTDSPIPQQHKFSDPDESVRDSGVHLREWLPATRDQSASLSSPSIDEKSGFRSLHESHQIMKGPEHEAIRDAVNSLSVVSDKPSKRLEGTQEIKESRGTSYELPQQQDKELGNEKVQSVDTRRSLDNRGPPRLRRSSTARERGISSHEKSDGFDRTENPAPQTPKRKERYPELDRSLPKALKPQSITDDTALVGAGLAGTGITTGITVSQERRPDSAMSVQSAPSRRSSANTNRLRTPEKMRSESAGSIRSASSGTPPLRRSDRKFSRDLRSLSQQEPESQRSSQHTKFDLAKEAVVLTPTPTFLHHANPTANEGRVRIKDMADVYDGFGEGRMGSPMSPTRPHSMRRRQSLQVLDLEAKVEQLTSENFKLAEAKAHAENSLKLTQRAAADLADRDAEIESLKATINWLHAEVTRLSEVNDGLTSANVTLGNQQNDRYGTLERQHAQTIRELEEMREAHDNLAAGMEGIVADQVRTAVEEKDNEIARLRAELEAAQETIREMQHQILAAKPSDNEFLTVRDEDYFDMACQQLCQHVQQWVLRFSKFSDMRACRLTSEINNDKVIDRLDNAILDGSDVDNYLADRVRRRDVFMSMTMTMIWEFVFTRYLFGMDREQRQKLKSLEKLLLEVGPPSAVHQWRATTLTLLSKREAFRQQRAKDTEAVVNEILKTLFTILPPPSHLEDQIQHQLTRVMRSAVDLSIEMRTQRAEYMMLPPLQPEYDANGDLASKVTFNAALMNERSGNTISNEELEAQNAIVRIVLFPLVVKKGDDMGAGDEEIVVCPAQVLVANDTPRERRVSSRGSNRSNQSSLNNNSRVSLPSAMPSEI
ncbi:hypothetical protein F5884DRAFT_771817 [Xylogone sp. PMI_703]|nr:hypothetical protein F5884DRAFT_771817 [Xylogone sp. PMI_703]